MQRPYSHRVALDQSAHIHAEFRELVSEAHPSQQAEVRVEAEQDPYYADGFAGHELAGRLATALTRFAEMQDGAQADEPEIVEIIDPADLEFSEEQSEIAEERAADITKAHQFIEAFAAERKKVGGSPTKKQKANFERFYKANLREHWSVNDFADHSLRLRTVVESIDANSNVPQSAKSDLIGRLFADVQEHIAQESIADIDPEQMAERIVTALEPTKFEHELTSTLLKSHFNSAERRDVVTVIDSVELFVRGLLRCLDYPSVVEKGLSIISFETPLIPSGSLFETYFRVFPSISLHTPELMGRTIGIGRVIEQIKSHTRGRIDVGKANGRNAFSEMSESMQSARTMTELERQKAVADARFGNLISTQTSLAAKELGPFVFDARLAAMKRVIDLLNSDDGKRMMTQLMGQRIAESENFFLPDSADIFIEAIGGKSADLREFLSALLNTDTAAMNEAGLYLPDPTSNVQLMAEAGVVDGSKFVTFFSDYGIDFRADGEPELTGQELEASLSSIRPVAIRLGDGYVMEVMLPNEYTGTEPTTTDAQVLIDQYGRDRYEEMKKLIESKVGARRRFETAIDKDTGHLFILRPESAEDLKDFHPLDELLGAHDAGPEEFEDDHIEVIERARFNIEQNRRRFLNDRGIMLVDTDGSERFTLTIHKHPNNPKAYVVQTEVDGPDGKKSAKVYMDSSLRFQLGNKKVRATGLLGALNAYAAELLEFFTCQEAVKTTEGTIEEGSSLTARIAHLRLLPDGQKFSYTQWVKCLESEGEDLELLSKRQAEKLATNRVSTYVSAVSADDAQKGPYQIVFPS